MSYHYTHGEIAKLHRGYGRKYDDDKSAARGASLIELQIGELHNIAAAIEDIADEIVPHRKAAKELRECKEDLRTRLIQWSWSWPRKWMRDNLDREFKWYVSLACDSYWPEQDRKPFDPFDKQWFADQLVSRLRKSATTKRKQLQEAIASLGLEYREPKP